MFRYYSTCWRQDIGLRNDEIRFEPVITNFDDIGSEKSNSYRGPEFHDKKKVICALKKEIARLESEPEFSFTDEELQQLPHVGTELWGVREIYTRDKQQDPKLVGREVLPLIVDSVFIKDGRLLIGHGFYFKKPDEVFKTKKRAEEHMEKLGGPLP